MRLSPMVPLLSILALANPALGQDADAERLAGERPTYGPDELTLLRHELISVRERTSVLAETQGTDAMKAATLMFAASDVESELEKLVFGYQLLGAVNGDTEEAWRIYEETALQSAQSIEERAAYVTRLEYSAATRSLKDALVDFYRIAGRSKHLLTGSR